MGFAISLRDQPGAGSVDVRELSVGVALAADARESVRRHRFAKGGICERLAVIAGNDYDSLITQAAETHAAQCSHRIRRWVAWGAAIVVVASVLAGFALVGLPHVFRNPVVRSVLTESRGATLGGWSRYETLLAAGVRIYEYQPTTIHAKTLGRREMVRYRYAEL